VLVGARNAAQAEQNAAAMTGDMCPEIFQRMTRISDEIMSSVPHVGNIFRHYP